MCSFYYKMRRLLQNESVDITHYRPVLLFYTPENIGKPLGFLMLMFSGAIEKQHQAVMD